MTTETESVSRLEDVFISIVAEELGLRPEQVRAADALFADGCTVPFVARYRKEATGGVIDAKLEEIFKRRSYFLELGERRDVILASISEQGKLNDELERSIRAAVTKQQLEDLYLPYKRKKRTRAQAARERGLEPLADSLLAGASDSPEELAAKYVDAEKQVPDVDAALAGARDILAERISESSDNRARLRAFMETEASFLAAVVSGKKEKGGVYRDYFDHREPLKNTPSHRLLAILRGEKERVLSTSLEIDDEQQLDTLAASWNVPIDSRCGRQVVEATRDGYKRLLRPSITNEVRTTARERAEGEAIRVFRDNLESLLLQPPIGQIPVMGLDPGFRTGCKLAVVDATGRVVATSTIFPVPPKARPEQSAKTITEFVKSHAVRAVAIGNGTGSRETEAFFRDLAAADAETFADVTVVIVPETGASVYSASQTARDELGDLDVSLRGAVSIARRLQDPLAELVKIDPKSLGVGQYQHDVTEKSLTAELKLAVEGVVNRVGVELNTASPALLRRVSGLSQALAKNVVAYRDQNGAFSTRHDLLKVGGFGPKAFEQAAGFLRIHSETATLDATAVHPERYALVEAMAGDLEVSIADLIGQPKLIARLDIGRYRDAEAGVGDFTLRDICTELERPGRDPRPEFRAPKWRDDVRSIENLEVDMVLEGRISNVTNFGAFVDLGVKRDGLVHLSELSHHWVKDPREVVNVSQIVTVKVMEVDKQRGRITLSMKALQPEPAKPKSKRGPRRRSSSKGGPPKGGKRPAKVSKPAKKESPAPETAKKVNAKDLDELLNKFKRRW